VPFPNLWMVPQWRTEEILLARLEDLGGRVEFGSPLTAFEPDTDGVTATLSTAAGREHVQADYLVGCDGGHSFVRRALGVRFAGESLESRRVIFADV
jgi:2-polyprenyl-6-methoxyphenol hydroxylase-like FAD-dependent oxidoreductase